LQARTLDHAVQSLQLDSSASWLLGIIGPAALALLGSALSWRSIVPERRAVLVLGALAVAIALAGASFAPGWTDRRSAASLALLALALPAAGLIPASSQRAGPREWVGSTACLAFSLVGLWMLARTCAPLWESSKRNDPLLGETAGALEPISSEASAVDLRAALALLRADPDLRRDRAVMLACPVNN